MLFSRKEKSQGKPSGSPRLATSMALVISIIVHASIFLIVGSVVIFEGAIPPNLFDSLGGGMVEESGPMEMEAPPLLEEAPMPDPIDDPLDTAPADAPMTTSIATSDIIASTVTSPSFNVSSAVSTGLLGPSVKNPMVGRSTRGTGTSRGPGAPRAANIFGRSVEANRLGVILDVSHSTHDLIDYAIEEIQSGFPEAILVFAPGCEMSSRESEIVPVSKFQDLAEEKYAGSKGNTTVPFIRNLLKRNAGFKKIWEKSDRNGLGYVVFVDISSNQGTILGGISQSFEFLIEKGADVIYWFADFDDRIDVALAEEVQKDLRRNGIKVIAHDFKPPLGQNKNDTKKVELLKDFTEKTGGEFFLETAQKKK